MAGETGLLQGLIDFSFRDSIAKRLVKLLYAIGILAGGISLVAGVVTGIQQSPAQGLLILVFGSVALFVWILSMRLMLEVVTVILRLGENIERIAGGRNP